MKSFTSPAQPLELFIASSIANAEKRERGWSNSSGRRRDVFFTAPVFRCFLLKLVSSGCQELKQSSHKESTKSVFSAGAAKCQLLTSLIRGFALWTLVLVGENWAPPPPPQLHQNREPRRRRRRRAGGRCRGKEKKKGAGERGERRSRKLKNKPWEATVISEEKVFVF